MFCDYAAFKLKSVNQNYDKEIEVFKLEHKTRSNTSLCMPESEIERCYGLISVTLFIILKNKDKIQSAVLCEEDQ